jgi:nucleoside phosphorylase
MMNSDYLKELSEKVDRSKDLTWGEQGEYLKISMDFRKLALKQYRIAIITALPKEHAAMEAMLDDVKHWPWPFSTSLLCCTGKIKSLSDEKEHDILLVQAHKMGNNSAAVTATKLIGDFPNIDYIIMVGIAGAIPNPKSPELHVRLGDIVVSRESGVIQYDLLKIGSKGIKRRGVAPPPSARLQSAVSLLESKSLKGERPWDHLIGRTRHIINSVRPTIDHDILYSRKIIGRRKIPHPNQPDRVADRPKVHYGTIGSANILLKNAKIRDKIRDELGVIAVEMEGSGIADAGWAAGIDGYLIIRGTCDYCDEYKNDIWQGYAAAVAAAYARALIEVLPVLV